MESKAGETEISCMIDCGSEQLIGILHTPSVPATIGVIIIVGGPQYRVGSHRQFVLLARDLAAAGITTLRFDYRGMGDSDGVQRGFEDNKNDVRAAIDWLISSRPMIQRVVLWGLCDGATSAAFYAAEDERVVGLVLLNPWVRSEQTLARSLLFHYYIKRLTNLPAWRKILFSPDSFAAALRSLMRVTRNAFVCNHREVSAASRMDALDSGHVMVGSGALSLVERFATALGKFSGPLLLILSGTDITANEFVEGEKGSAKLSKRLAQQNVTRRLLDDADHTFSRHEWRCCVSEWTGVWLSGLRHKYE